MDEVDLAALGLHFALLSLMAIGGVSSILPDMQRYMVEAHHWLSGTQFADAYALGQAAPGPNMMFVTLLGLQVAGWTGAIVATLLTMVVVPILYWELRRRDARGRPPTEAPYENADGRLQRIESAADFVAA